MSDGFVYANGRIAAEPRWADRVRRNELGPDGIPLRMKGMMELAAAHARRPWLSLQEAPTVVSVAPANQTGQ